MPWYHSTIEGHIDILLKYAGFYQFDEFFASHPIFSPFKGHNFFFLFIDPNQTKHLEFGTKKFGWSLYLELPVANVT
jgi:hypothetical protein